MFKSYKSFYNLQKSKWNCKKNTLFKKHFWMCSLLIVKKNSQMISTWANKKIFLKG